ncbi:hypothetical protein BGX24_003095 [Mortierella sp. AD032]|nr:hypothetical protein BGX24_003095 [Mortierella sp. AD032]
MHSEAAPIIWPHQNRQEKPNDNLRRPQGAANLSMSKPEPPSFPGINHNNILNNNNNTSVAIFSSRINLSITNRTQSNTSNNTSHKPFQYSSRSSSIRDKTDKARENTMRRVQVGRVAKNTKRRSGPQGFLNIVKNRVAPYPSPLHHNNSAEVPVSVIYADNRAHRLAHIHPYNRTRISPPQECGWKQVWEAVYKIRESMLRCVQNGRISKDHCPPRPRGLLKLAKSNSVRSPKVNIDTINDYNYKDRRDNNINNSGSGSLSPTNSSASFNHRNGASIHHISRSNKILETIKTKRDEILRGIRHGRVTKDKRHHQCPRGIANLVMNTLSPSNALAFHTNRLGSIEMNIFHSNY